MPPSRPEQAHHPSRFPRVPSDPSERRLLPVCGLLLPAQVAATSAPHSRGETFRRHQLLPPCLLLRVGIGISSEELPMSDVAGAENSDSRPRHWNLMIKIMATYAQGQGPIPLGNAREIIERQDALDAIAQLAALVDETYNAGLISENKASFGMLLLMVLQEYVSPLPDAGDSEDQLRGDLEEAVNALRASRP
jgi:hypothetical protein